uniref:AKAP7_NLS domain-containing protein n=1 Tax=Glossina pallidipes TaxID=7398 RepID=A0A1B0A089_GLOPL
MENSTRKLSNGLIELKIHVAAAFFKTVTDFKRLRAHSSCEIHVPPRAVFNQEPYIRIKGKTSDVVNEVKRQIDFEILNARRTLKSDYFYGVVLCGEIREKFVTFRREVLAAQIPGIGEDLFRSDTHLHISFGICVLADEIEKQKAITLLQSCGEFVRDMKMPFKIHAKGLSFKGDSPSAVRTLRAGIDCPDLVKFADRCTKRFNDSGLGNPRFSSNQVTLHVGLMDGGHSDGGRWSFTNTFDAREILRRWGDYDFGTMDCSEAKLCVIISSTSKEYYKVYSTVQLATCDTCFIKWLFLFGVNSEIDLGLLSRKLRELFLSAAQLPRHRMIALVVSLIESKYVNGENDLNLTPFYDTSSDNC